MKEQKEILEQQLQWTKEQIRILDEMEEILQVMKSLAEYAAKNDLSEGERSELSRQLEVLKSQYDDLEWQKHIIVH